MRLSRFFLGISFAAVSAVAAAEAPAIMFVIDNSQSMLVTDPGHTRFKVLDALLDSIYAVAPSAKVGAVIFSDRLAFDYRDNDFFQPLFPGDSDQHDSFIPPTSLDTTFGEWMKTGLDTLKDLLAIDAEGALVHQTRLPKERMPRNGGGGADITLGFDAARLALENCGRPKDARYILFFSDGASNVSDEIRLDREFAYETGSRTPATFTICFDPASRRPPQTLMRMTGNIRRNRYSAANPLSAAFGVKRPADELRSLLERRVFPKILADQRRASEYMGSALAQSREEPVLRPGFSDGENLTSMSEGQGPNSLMDGKTEP